jgi:AbrB family looped-hinge helix DNA binding protein
MSDKDMKTPKGKKFYGSVTVSERGQIVIPAEARKDFNIGIGDKILVFGDLKTGLWITTFGVLEKNMQGSAELFRDIESRLKKSGKKSESAPDKYGEV